MSELIAIIGLTATGKSGLAMELARRFDGEIICADSRTIYRGMDIGTAKPSLEDQIEIPHHLLDIVDPDQRYSAAEFKAAALGVIGDIRSRGKLPILVGGSGLYVYSVIYDYRFPAGAESRRRRELDAQSLDALVGQLQKLDPEMLASIDIKNKRRVVRALETVGQPRVQAQQLAPGLRLIGLKPEPEVLFQNIVQRTKLMLEGGLVEEVEWLVGKFGKGIEPLNTVGYKEMIEYLDGRHSRDEAEHLINLHTRQLAKRQLTWFKRNAETRWFGEVAAAIKYVIE